MKDSQTMASSLAKNANLDHASVEKVLRALGSEQLAANLRNSLGEHGVQKLQVGDLKLAVRIGKSTIIV